MLYTVHGLHSRVHGVHDEQDDLRGLDLNLLQVFAAVAREKHVARAAARLGSSPSATSHALRRLRDRMNDPLLVRGAHGLVLTPRGEALALAVTRALAEIGRGIREPAGFDPSTSRRVLRIAAADGFDVVLLPTLLEALRRQAPSMDLVVSRPSASELSRSLQAGEHDLYYGVLPSRPAFAGLLPDPGSRGLKALTAYTEGWVCLARRGHPRIRRRIALTRYVAEGHVLYSPSGGGPGIVDRSLEAKGMTRRVVLRVASFHSALDAVARTDLVWTGPRRIAESIDREERLLRLRVPLELPDYPVQIVWHERFDAEPAHRWLRQLLVKLASERATSRRP